MQHNMEVFVTSGVQIRMILKYENSVIFGTSLELSLYGHREWWSVYSGFALDEKNRTCTRFSAVAEHMCASQEIHLELYLQCTG